MQKSEEEVPEGGAGLEVRASGDASLPPRWEGLLAGLLADLLPPGPILGMPSHALPYAHTPTLGTPSPTTPLILLLISCSRCINLDFPLIFCSRCLTLQPCSCSLPPAPARSPVWCWWTRTRWPRCRTASWPAASARSSSTGSSGENSEQCREVGGRAVEQL